MKTLATMGIEVWRVRETPGNDLKLDELIHNIEIALNINKTQIEASMAQADFSLTELLAQPDLKSKLLRILRTAS